MTSLEKLAAAKRLDPGWLREQGVEDLPGGGVSIAYLDDDGEVAYRRRRDVPGCASRFETPKGVRSIVYGRHRLDQKDVFDLMHVCEGESDTWALWAAGMPAVGVAGNSCTRCLMLADLGGARTVYVCKQDTPGNPKADETFVSRVLDRLIEVGFDGTVSVVEPLKGYKDVSDMRAADADRFAADWAKQRAAARRMFVGAHPGGGGPAPFSTNGTAEPTFPEPIPASQLVAAADGGAWLVDGLLRRGEITLLSALWKSGKTTLLAHLLRAFEKGEKFLGKNVQPARVLYVTEETQARWAARRDAVGIKDHVEFVVRPFKAKPNPKLWAGLIDYLAGLVGSRGYDVVLMDTLANLWPVRDENDASAVGEALMPLHSITEHAALQLVHHTRKSDGAEATASRGSGALTGFVDTILELRRFAPADRKDRRRVLTGYGRDDETPDELVVELTECGYVARGDRDSVSNEDLGGVIAGLLAGPPGMTPQQVLDSWPDGGAKPGLGRVSAALKAGAADGLWVQSGEGKRGSPWTFYLPFGGP